MTQPAPYLRIFSMFLTDRTRTSIQNALAAEENGLSWPEDEAEIPDTWLMLGLPQEALRAVLEELDGLELGETSGKVKTLLHASLQDWTERQGETV